MTCLGEKGEIFLQVKILCYTVYNKKYFQTIIFFKPGGGGGGGDNTSTVVNRIQRMIQYVRN